MLMRKGKGLREGNGNGGMHCGSPPFFVLKLPVAVALARAPGKIALGNGGGVKILLCVDAGQLLSW